MTSGIHDTVVLSVLIFENIVCLAVLKEKGLDFLCLY